MKLTRVVTIAATAGLMAVPAVAQQGNADPDVKVTGGALPAGWMAQTDRGRRDSAQSAASIANSVKFSKMGEGWHLTIGNGSIVYNPSNTASGNYHVVASFTQTKAPAGMGHPEGYGLFIGGKDLQSGTPTYTYFLVRMDGQFLVKQFSGKGDRAGDPTNVTEGPWTAHEAVNKADAAGKQTNELAIGIKDGKASFTVNGKEVFSTDASKIHTDGVAGFRVNHNLDIHVAGFAIHKL